MSARRYALVIAPYGFPRRAVVVPVEESANMRSARRWADRYLQGLKQGWERSDEGGWTKDPRGEDGVCEVVALTGL